jgi:hypothetical protein
MGNCTDSSFSHYMLCLVATVAVSCVSFGIIGWLTCIMDAMRVFGENATGLPQFDTEHQEVCKGCALGKYTKTVFSSNDNRSGILYLVHSDVCRPMSSISLGGCE